MYSCHYLKLPYCLTCVSNVHSRTCTRSTVTVHVPHTISLVGRNDVHREPIKITMPSASKYPINICNHIPMHFKMPYYYTSTEILQFQVQRLVLLTCGHHSANSPLSYYVLFTTRCLLGRKKHCDKSINVQNFSRVSNYTQVRAISKSKQSIRYIYQYAHFIYLRLIKINL